MKLGQGIHRLTDIEQIGKNQTNFFKSWDSDQWPSKPKEYICLCLTTNILVGTL